MYKVSYMDTYSFLETTAEISIAFTGFISIFFVLARQTGSFHPLTALSIRIILTAGISCPFLAALPLVLSDTPLNETTVWRISSGAVLALGVFINLYLFRHRQVFLRADRTSVGIAFTLNLASLILPTLNVIGVPFEPNSAAHLASIWSILGIGSINFVGLVLFVLNQPDRSSH